MARPRRFLIRMTAFLLAVALLAGALFLPMRDAFMTNAPLNGLIVGVFLLGILFNFRQILMLYPEVAWIESFRSQKNPLSLTRPPRLLAPMANMLREKQERGARFTLSALAMRSVLDGISARLDESRDISRYMIGLLVFLGLLGTFWGLLGTMSSVRDVISGLNTGSGDATQVFADLKRGLEAPLSGMGTAFSSSLFGLAGSLILGFLDLQAGQAQNRFFNDLEEWLSSQTRLSSGALGGDGEQGVPAYVQALLEQTAESLESLQRTLARGEESRISANATLGTLGTQLSALVDTVRTEQQLMRALAEAHIEMKPILAKLAEGAGRAGIDDATRAHIRNLDAHVARLVEDVHNGRDEVIAQVRNEIKLLARTIAAIGEGGER